MTNARRIALGSVAALLVLLALAPAVGAVEYRLQVANLFDTAFYSFVKLAELVDGASGPGLDRLTASIDLGQLPRGPMLWDRHPEQISENVARAYGAKRVRAEVTLGGDGDRLWDEIRWDGQPGEQTVWLVTPAARQPQRMLRVALKGTGPVRQFLPYRVTGGSAKVAAVTYPLNFLWFYEERGTAWDRYLSSKLNLGSGIAAVVAENFNRTFPDRVYLIVRHGAEPTTFKAMLIWHTRHEDQEAPGDVDRAPVR
jgi:hypothetical protein